MTIDLGDILNHANKPVWPATLPENVVKTTRNGTSGNVLLVCEHASRFIPTGLSNLGLDEEASRSHIAWDPGALKVAELLSESLDATLVSHKISRLVFDCNRPPSSPHAVREVSEVFNIPGNTGLTNAERHERTTHIYEPFRKALETQIKTRAETVLVTIHTFTPVYNGAPRAVEIGILHDADSRLADAMLEVAAANPAYLTERNQPYGPADGVTHTLVEHAAPAGLLNVMIEIRNDLVLTEKDQAKVAAWLGDILTSALKALVEES